MDAQRQLSVSSSNLLLVARATCFYLQDLKRIPCVEYSLRILRGLHSTMEQGTMNNSAGCFYSLPLVATVRDAASAAQQLSTAVVLVQQHTAHMANTRNNQTVTQHQSNNCTATREGIRTFQDLGVQLLKNLLEHFLQLLRLPQVDFRRQARYELRVEVFGAPVGSFGAANALEERKGRCRRIYKAEWKLQRESSYLGQLIQHDRALHLCTFTSAACTRSSHLDGVLHANVRRIDLIPR
mmetsp:Transcript_34263/g.80057  ORF Transcript_34263/g.80057 Transcript_34263/m.80057 type:complete len:239 (-) Transcript_34263:650-1366(-)